jgi:hypothetical protein
MVWDERRTAGDMSLALDVITGSDLDNRRIGAITDMSVAF